MNQENDPILIGHSEDIDKDTVEIFEHEEVDYAIYHLDTGYFATQGQCNCEEHAPLSEAVIEGEDLECVSCGRLYSIVSGDSVSDPDGQPLKIYDVTEEDGNIFLNL